MRSVLIKRFGAEEGYNRELRKFVNRAAGTTGFCVLCLVLASVGVSDPTLRFDIIAKFLIEDVLVIALPVVVLDIVMTSYVFLSFRSTQSRDCR